mmetsp:Transcript_58092/g.131621  ORF Transcript_58092/g.131621 Transcript_58092/m.131621 type:complete len:251 (-) Transcript_58092:200-952(-)|eukprot:CAMPEP_0172643508 /NCGR_PEP_ID=MMETSP1068-20121228/237163_1 /TAXON_ID=35684 /ORGANISM="Pseudopedinella elastica, Strain CCMP716" /LENGTH=250 /DNA_ID=CAMNT_0013457581 /DNA_START=83 /DNA_END=835 /DNA_ORIENTATION=+
MPQTSNRPSSASGAYSESRKKLRNQRVLHEQIIEAQEEQAWLERAILVSRRREERLKYEEAERKRIHLKVQHVKALKEIKASNLEKAKNDKLEHIRMMKIRVEDKKAELISRLRVPKEEKLEPVSPVAGFRSQSEESPRGGKSMLHYLALHKKQSIEDRILKEVPKLEKRMETMKFSNLDPTLAKKAGLLKRLRVTNNKVLEQSQRLKKLEPPHSRLVTRREVLPITPVKAWSSPATPTFTRYSKPSELV